MLNLSNRGSHTFSIPASIIGEVPRASLLLGAHVLRSAHSSIINRSRSPPPTLKNWESRSFLGEIFILRLMKFTLWRDALVFYYVFCVVVAVNRRCYEDTLFSQVQAGKSILQLSFSMLATSKRGVTHPLCTEIPHWLPFSLTTFSFLKKFGSLKKV